MCFGQGQPWGVQKVVLASPRLLVVWVCSSCLQGSHLHALCAGLKSATWMDLVGRKISAGVVGTGAAEHLVEAGKCCSFIHFGFSVGDPYFRWWKIKTRKSDKRTVVPSHVVSSLTGAEMQTEQIKLTLQARRFQTVLCLSPVKKDARLAPIWGLAVPMTESAAAAGPAVLKAGDTTAAGCRSGVSIRIPSEAAEWVTGIKGHYLSQHSMFMGEVWLSGCTRFWRKGKKIKTTKQTKLVC